MEAVSVPLVEYGIARFALPGHGESGDHCFVRGTPGGLLIAAIDGIGHGEEAALAAKTAISVLESHQDEPIITLVQSCHENLKSTRGVVMSLALIDSVHGMMTWLGVGNVQGVLMRAGARKGTVQEVMLQRAGVVGSQLPPLQASVLPIARGDTLIFVTDGIRGEFFQGLSSMEPPQRAADKILEGYCPGKDDALVLVARLTGIRP